MERECEYHGIAFISRGRSEEHNTNVRMFEVEHNGERIELHPFAAKQLAQLSEAELAAEMKRATI